MVWLLVIQQLPHLAMLARGVPAEKRFVTDLSGQRRGSRLQLLLLLPVYGDQSPLAINCVDRVENAVDHCL